MRAPIYDDTPGGRDAPIVAWRTRCFMAAGFGPFHATVLARRRDIDREEVERLLDRGATHSQAIAIVL